ncbi:MAG: L,D-transpeptidase [Gammaproteobacteria bacterium]|nr:L,D-transpeptidase [Gammaproteobacteria bacterium]
MSGQTQHRGSVRQPSFYVKQATHQRHPHLFITLLFVFLFGSFFCLHAHAETPTLSLKITPIESQAHVKYAYADNDSDDDGDEEEDYNDGPSEDANAQAGDNVTITKKSTDYADRLPSSVPAIGEKFVLIDPRHHVWGAYDTNGVLIKAGLATAGNSWCRDLRQPCKTKAGEFRIKSLGSAGCVSSIFPLPRGGAPMPYCMFFHGGQALHGSPSGAVIEGNVSHGCVRLHIEDARWLRYNFVTIGTKVIIKPY